MGLRAQDGHGCTMILHRAFASRRGPQTVFGTSGSRLPRGAALFALSVLLGGLVLPVLGVVLADEPAPLCCSKGRCCCADVARNTDEGPCLRRGCSCEHPDEAVNGAPLLLEAVLPCAAPLAAASPAEARWTSSDDPPIARADRPAVPPPRRSLPA